ncbi:hypothetical protein OG921_12010 [Aldersonia sp. NBC_00410]|uniref:hypothetical protein n=1 Tax=Aldersonia sp. NBC_00410 TaxID=2975954 RepID=UPI002253B27A|nr:hypothetical protein [Aldersonia sp. NBC_00410]MCX5043891.1 hypothetical protein [Aldersonia sp. NBC_00410]
MSESHTSESAANADQPVDDVVEELLDPSESLDSDELGSEGDDVYDAPEAWSEADEFGTTAREAAAGESVGQKLAREVPDVDESG